MESFAIMDCLREHYDKANCSKIQMKLNLIALVYSVALLRGVHILDNVGFSADLKIFSKFYFLCSKVWYNFYVRSVNYLKEEHLLRKISTNLLVGYSKCCNKIESTANGQLSIGIVTNTLHKYLA